MREREREWEERYLKQESAAADEEGVGVGFGEQHVRIEEVSAAALVAHDNQGVKQAAIVLQDRVQLDGEVPTAPIHSGVKERHGAFVTHGTLSDDAVAEGVWRWTVKVHIEYEHLGPLHSNPNMRSDG